MQITGIKKELTDLKKGYAPNFKTIEELLKTKKEDIHKLTNKELFRIVQHYNPEFKTEADLTNEVLERMVKGEDP